MADNEEQALVQGVLRKERAAFDAFFEAYFSRVYRFCAGRMDDPAACEDVVQETMIKAINKLHTWRGEAGLFTWLCQIGRNEIANWYRKHGKKQENTLSFDEDPALRAVLESLDAAHSLDEGEQFSTAQLVQTTLDYLPDNYGKALEWKYLEGLTVEEIAQRMDTGVIAVQSLLARARKAFREGFKELTLEVGT